MKEQHNKEFITEEIILSSNRGVCLVRFDEIQGPICIFQKGLDDAFAQKVCIKSHLSTMSLSSSSDNIKNEFIDSVIPFLDEGYIAYTNFFYIDDKNARGGKRAVGIVTLVDREEQMNLYKAIPELSEKIKLIAKNIDRSEKVSKKVQKQITALLNLENLSVDFDSQNDSIQLIKERIEKEDIEKPAPINEEMKEKGSFKFLLEKIPFGLDKAIFALLKNERVLILGEKEEITLTLNTLRWFLPHKKLYNDLWTVPLMDAEALFSRSSESITLHVLGIQADSFYEIIDNDFAEGITEKNTVTENLPLQSKVIVNLNKGIVLGGSANVYCDKILKSIKERSFDDSVEIISKHVENLLERVFDLILLVIDEANKRSFENFIKKTLEGELSLLVTIISETNPAIVEKMLKLFSIYKIRID